MDTKWQTVRDTIKERNQYMYNNSMFSDIQFSVVDSKGDTVTVPAHKYVLAISSPVFEPMFYGELAETRRLIDLPDCTAEGLLELFRYMYYDEVQLTGSHVMEVLYLAKKYFVPSLVKKCTEYIEKEIGPEDVFTVLPQVEKLEDEKLKEICWKIVDSETQRAVTSEPFLTVTQETLCDILERDTLCITEVELFQAVHSWACKKIEEQELSEDGKSKRAVLGYKAIHLIRFPLISLQQFSEIVLFTEILDLKEATELIKYFGSVGGKPSSLDTFKTKARKGMKTTGSCKRFGSFSSGWKYSRYVADCITFTVSSQVHLTGVRLYGSRGSQYTVDLAIYKGGKKESTSTLYHSSSTFTRDSEMTDGYYGFTITLEKPVCLDPGMSHTIEAVINGPPSLYGCNGMEVVKCENVEFKFNQSLGGRTCHNTGQFPELLFYSRV